MEPTTLEMAQPTDYIGSRPLQVNQRTGAVRVLTERGLVVNSQLRLDEWRRLDAAVQRVALQRLNAVQHLRQAGLVVPIPSFGTLTTQYSQVDEATAAEVSMTGESRGERSRLEFGIVNRPLPVIFKEFAIPIRQLTASRLMGTPLDTSHATAATRVVAEKEESMLLNGDSTVVFDGGTIYGYRTEPNRNTDTATNYGGGDWGTIANVVATVAGMINAAQGDGYYGPYNLYASTTQYNQATLAYYTDGSGDTPRDRIMAMPQISMFEPSDTLADGNLVLVQMTEDVIDWVEHQAISVVEWVSADGMVAHFRVQAVAAPRVKSDKNSKSGVVHATGA